MGTFNILQRLAFLYSLRSQKARGKSLVLNPLISRFSENQAFASAYVSEAVVSELRLPASEGSIRPVSQELLLLSLRQLPILPPSPSLFGHETHHCVDTPSHKAHRDVLILCNMALVESFAIGRMWPFFLTTPLSLSTLHTFQKEEHHF